MAEQPKKIYTMEDNIKSMYFQNRDILKALEEIKQKLGMTKQDDDFDGSQF